MTTKLTRAEKSMLNKSFIGSCLSFAFTSNITALAKGFAISMIPALREYYKDEDDFKEAFTRHQEFFNTNTVSTGLITGLAISMEKKRAENKEKIPGDSISKIKASLMGPLAGVGDSFFFNGVRIIVAGIAIGMSTDGNIMGPLFFALVYGGIVLASKYYLLVQGYIYGTKFIDKAFESGLIQIITKVAAIVGMTMAGVMVASSVKFNIVWEPMVNGAAVSIQGILDTIAPGIMSLVIWYVVFRALKNKVSPTKLILIIMGACLVLSFFGIV